MIHFIHLNNFGSVQIPIWAQLAPIYLFKRNVYVTVR